METLIGGTLAKVLETGRLRYNALFAHARHNMPSLDGVAFANHLRATVAPIVDAVAAVAPEAAAEVVDVLFEFSLELVGKDLLTRYPALADGWSRLLTGLPRHLSAAPRLFAGSVTNALYNLSLTPGARPRDWIDDLLRLGVLCPDVAALLEAGQVCAWRAGLPHYRDSTLEKCARLPAPLARAALGLASEDNGVDVKAVLSQLKSDPWLHPKAAGRPPAAGRQLRVVATVGGFRGFGGPFLRPPIIAFSERHFHVGDGERCWVLIADRFGAIFHPAGTDLPKDASEPAFRIDKRGKVTRGKESQAFEELQDAASHAANGTTLAVTVPLSHRVFLIAYTEAAP